MTIIDVAAASDPSPDVARAPSRWRIAGASFLHANSGHLLANVGALVAPGGLIEAYDRRWRLPLVYVLSVLSGSVAGLALTARSPAEAPLLDVLARGAIATLTISALFTIGRLLIARQDWRRGGLVQL